MFCCISVIHDLIYFYYHYFHFIFVFFCFIFLFPLFTFLALFMFLEITHIYTFIYSCILLLCILCILCFFHFPPAVVIFGSVLKPSGRYQVVQAIDSSSLNCIPIFNTYMQGVSSLYYLLNTTSRAIQVGLMQQGLSIQNISGAVPQAFKLFSFKKFGVIFKKFQFKN